MISAVVLTRNEEQDLPGCLDALAWCDDVHVLDSESTDRTREIAEARGCAVTVRGFDNYAAQRNASLALRFRYEWVLVVDADERPTPELVAEMRQAVESAPQAVAGFRIRRRDYLDGTWLKHAQMTPYYVRLLRVGRARYVRAINERVEVDGEIVALKGALDHFPFSKGMGHWEARHDRYSTLEAQQIVANRRSGAPFSVWAAMLERDFHRRRYHQKELFYRMPLRPLVRFLYLYGLRRGFLDGKAGYRYARLQAAYEAMIVAKTKELERRG